MSYFKKLFCSILPVLKYMFLSYAVIIISFLFYCLMGYNEVNMFVINYATYILLGFNVIYILYLLKNNKVCLKKTKSIIPFVLLGIGFACFFNMIIFKININEVVKMNLLFLIFSSVIVGPFIEEIIFRKILVDKLERFNNRIVTIIIASFIFAIMHNGIINIIYTFLLGIVLNTIYVKNKNLLYPLIVHSSSNLIVMFLTGYNSFILMLSFVLLVIGMLLVKRDYLLK